MMAVPKSQEPFEFVKYLNQSVMREVHPLPKVDNILSGAPNPGFLQIVTSHTF